MNRVLLQKELIQHGHALVLIALVAVGGSEAVTRALDLQGTFGSPFHKLAFALISILPVALSMVGSRLVTNEFRNPSQLFVEALPLKRSRLLLVKWCLGMFSCSVFVLGMLVVSVVLHGEREVLSGRFVLLLVVRATAWGWFAFAFFFLTGFLGRYRAAIYIILGSGLLALDEMTRIPVTDFPPFRLILPSDFAYEREVFPVADLVWTGLMVVGLSVAGLWLGLARDGGVAARLAGKMAYSEKMFLGVVIVAEWAAVVLVGMKQEEAKPFDLPDAVTEESGEAVVKIVPTSTGAIDLEVSLGQWLATECESARRWVGASTWPMVCLVEHDGLDDPGEFVEEEVHGRNAVFFYADYRDPAFDRREFLKEVLAACLEVRLADRADLEHRRWLRLGFCEVWDERDKLGRPISEFEGAWVGRLEKLSLADGLGPGQIRDWFRLCENFEEGEEEALASAGIVVFARLAGSEGLKELLEPILGVELPNDARATLYDWSHRVPRETEKVTGEPFGEFVAAWWRALDQGVAVSLERGGD